MDFGHLGLVVLLFLLALVVFGPKRMIAMVSQLGDMLRQTRDAMKQMDWTGGDGAESPTSEGTPPPAERPRAVESAPPKEGE